MKAIHKYVKFIPLVLLLSACSGPNGHRTGHEYMPDMAHSIAVEANVYNHYSGNNFDDKSVMNSKMTSMARLPVKGTVPRGYVGIADATSQESMDNMHMVLQGMNSGRGGVYTPYNGNVPYYYADTEEDRTRAMREIGKNPFPITKRSLAKGKELYVIYCGICHGEKADGSGYLVRDEGGKYPAQPANLINDEFTAASEGRFYHAIMYGKNAMGSYADKLSYEERWDVIHYIRSLQAGGKSLVYNETQNTLNNAVPEAKMPKKMAENKVEITSPTMENSINKDKNVHEHN